MLLSVICYFVYLHIYICILTETRKYANASLSIKNVITLT